MPKIWAISMQQFKEPKNPRSIMALANAAKKRASENAFEEFRKEFKAYAKSQKTITITTR